MRTALAARVAAATATLSIGAVVAAVPVAAAESVTQHDAIDVASSGVTITCAGLTLAPVSGTLDAVFHENADGAGRYHYSGTNTADGVRLVDGAGIGYRLQGTSSFTGTSVDPQGEDNAVFTTTATFVVLTDDGGRVGTVHLLEHLGRNGDLRLDDGSCTGTGGEG